MIDSLGNTTFVNFEKKNKATGIIYKMKTMRFPVRVLLSLYHTLFHSHLNYGVSVWGVADALYLDKIRLMQKRYELLLTLII